MRYLHILLSVLLTSIIVYGCSSHAEEAPAVNEGKSLNILETTETYLLKDDMELLDHINIVQHLGSDRMLIVDNKPSISLFENYEMTGNIGESGAGPCEYEGVSAFDVSSDTVYVLSAAQSKIISYSIESGECLGEISHEELSSQSYIYRTGNQFILGSQAYSFGTPDSTVLMHRLTDDKVMEPLKLNVGDLNRIKTPIALRAAGLDFGVSGKQVFTYFPLTSKLFVLNEQDDSIKSFPVDIDIKREEVKAAGEDIDQLLEIIRGDFEFISRIFTVNDHIALVYQQNAIDTEGSKYFIQLYSSGGDFLGEFEGDYPFLSFHDDQLVELREVEDPGSDYSYEIAYRKIQGL